MEHAPLTALRTDRLILTRVGNFLHFHLSQANLHLTGISLLRGETLLKYIVWVLSITEHGITELREVAVELFSS